MSEQENTMNKLTDEQVSEEKGETNKVTTSEKDNKVAKASPSSSKEVPVILTKEELSLLDYADFSTPARMLALGEVLCKSALVPLKKPEDVVVALMTGKELNLPFITSMSQIYPINGRPTIGVHIQRALCIKAGIVIEKIEDAISIYSFVEKIGEGEKVKFKEVLKGTLEEQPKGTAKKAVDTRTTYKLTREIKMPSGKYKEVTATGSFSISEATEAGLLEKDVWVKYWRRMLDARAFTNAVKEIASDITLGLSAPNELSNDFYVNESGEEVYNAEIVE
jgi:hypothetical protein